MTPSPAVEHVDRHVVEHWEQPRVEEVATEPAFDQEREQRGANAAGRADVGPHGHRARARELAGGPHRDAEVRVEVLALARVGSGRGVHSVYGTQKIGDRARRGCRKTFG